MSWIRDGEGNYSLYIHIPFCQVRCTYCDFNTYAGLDSLIPEYTRALAREVELIGRAAARRLPVHTIFFGGGTPSRVPLEHLQTLFDALRSSFLLKPDAEVSLEANPGTVTQEVLRGLRELGVNRLSFGVQSAHEPELRLFGRIHSFEDAIEAVGLARRAGFDNLNLDLIFGIPKQTMPIWRDTLRRTLALAPEHLSLYALSLEYGTPLRAWVRRGLVEAPNPDLAAEMYEWASEVLEAHGYVQYEISNWARTAPVSPSSISNDQSPMSMPQYACRHNLQYWRNLPYLGFGAGAHGCAEGWRYSNVLGPAQYIQRLGTGRASEFPFSPALVERHAVPASEAMDETMMLGLRLVNEGVNLEDFRRRFASRAEETYRPQLASLARLGLIDLLPDRVRLARRGRLLGNRVFAEFVGD